jgi:hypothetical protein
MKFPSFFLEATPGFFTASGLFFGTCKIPDNQADDREYKNNKRPDDFFGSGFLALKNIQNCPDIPDNN